MSGIEVIGVIATVLTLLDAVASVSSALKSASGLPPAFRQVEQRLPLAQSILHDTKKLNLEESVWRAIKPTVEHCEGDVKSLKHIFEGLKLPSKNFNIRRYYNLVKAMGKGNEVENLMKGIFMDLQLLAANHSIRGVVSARVKELDDAVKALSNVPSSVPKEIFESANERNSQNVYGGRAYQNNMSGFNNKQINYNAAVTRNYGRRSNLNYDDDDDESGED
ncbi:hypothetical protein AYL99_10996 [Fonsecaea erecta]|uniref:NACHT-NTPase and P-loop NTPases N-terminal domain-containing protein n=1 Tax=Fonsecaea erecta TaxID=1367422 RepID=A0A178Z481_9EURO|nr:hypothetical protein AYL99_10996 [Fonsecaea erecta]OAP54548.1 hypothetical protein AYL99_10996 [Fonsecaea erecta]